jgi:SAM-dependent MidA family methyltransferase
VSLREIIVDEIRRRGSIPFSRYMELCLYHPQLGYYFRPGKRFGKAGDFYTSSDVHAVFGRLLARRFADMWRALGSPARLDLIELGPGRGQFASDALDWSGKRFPGFFQALRYLLVERSPALRDQLHERFSEHLAVGKVLIYETLDAATPRLFPHVIIFANELFDALPVDILDHRGAVRVAVQHGGFCEEFVLPSTQELQYLDRYSLRPRQGERVEVALASLSWMDRIAAAFDGRQGFAVFIDYGYTQDQQLAGRHLDTLTTYRAHRVSFSPYEAPGEQDITAHVNFTALRTRARELGLDPIVLLTQSQFLLAIGEESQFADAFRDCKLPQEQAKVALQLNHLISPEGMGEIFQVLVLSAGVRGEEIARLGGLTLSH